MSAAAQVLRDNRPRYIEDFVRSGPDVFNGESVTGDPSPDQDWLPAFRRAVFYHLTTRTGATSPLTRIHRKKILIGKTRNNYRLSGRLDIFGVWLEGLFPEVELNFYNGSDGIFVHYPTTGPGTGTSFALDAPFTGRGGNSLISNLRLYSSGTLSTPGPTGTRGLIAQSRVGCHRVTVQGFGWHGIHVTASAAGRGEDGIDGNISNANGSSFEFCESINNGYAPGTDSRLETAANPTGLREWGCGMKMEGPDANVVLTTRCRFQGNAGWGMLDNGFLSNLHNLNTYTLNGHTVSQAEADIINEVNGARSEAELRTWISLYGVTVGNRMNLGYAAKNPNNRGIQLVPYVELSTPVPVVDCDFPYFVCGGQGGKFTASTSRWLGRAEGPWSFNRKLDDIIGVGLQDTVAFGESNSDLDTVLQRWATSQGDDWRWVFSHWVGDSPTGTGHPNRAGFIKLARNNANTQIAALLTTAQSRDNGVIGGAALDAGRWVRTHEYISNYGANCRRVFYGTGNPMTGTTNPATTVSGLTVGDRFYRLDIVDGQPCEFIVVSENGANAWRVVSTPKAGHREVIDTQNQWETCVQLEQAESDGLFVAEVLALGLDQGSAEFGYYSALICWSKLSGAATLIDAHVLRDTVPGTGLQVQVVASGANILVQMRSTDAGASGWCEGREITRMGGV